MLLRAWPAARCRIAGVVRLRSYHQTRGTALQKIDQKAPDPAQAAPPRAGHKRPEFLQFLHSKCSQADVVIIDSNNIASSQTNGEVYGTEQFNASFADHLRYIAAIAGNPRERYAVFDDVRGAKLNFVSRSRIFIAEKKRMSKNLIAKSFVFLLEGALDAYNILALHLRGISPRHNCWATASQCGYRLVEPAAGRRADDAIAALCRIIVDEGPTKKILVVSNDRDLLQLITRRVSVVQLPSSHIEHAGRYRLYTRSAFYSQYGYPPMMAPLYFALTGGRPFKHLEGFNLDHKTAMLLCRDFWCRLKSQLDEGHRPPIAILRNMYLNALQKMPSRLKKQVPFYNMSYKGRLIDNLLLNRDVSSLPDDFRLMSASEDKAAKAWLPRLTEGGLRWNPFVTVLSDSRPRDLIPAAESVIGHLNDSRKLVWMHPQNRRRARLIQLYVEQLSKVLHVLHIKHIKYAVTSNDQAIDVAVVPNHASAKYGLAGISNHAFMIVTETDLSKNYAQILDVPLDSNINDQRMINLLFGRENDQIGLNSFAYLQYTKAVSDGWTIHKVHHEVLDACYRWRFPEQDIL